MRFMCFQWMAFSQDDLQDALHNRGIEFDTFSYKFDGIYEDPYLYRNFKSIMKSGNYDAVISWNFWPILADVCKDICVPYIAWVYDCPISYDIRRWAQYPTSYMFIFDKNEYNKYRELNISNIHHLQLAVNTGRIDSLSLNDIEKEHYGEADISFLGNMYNSDYELYLSNFTDWEKGYIESVIRAQGTFYGDLIFSEIFDDHFLELIMKRWNETGILNSTNLDNFRLWFMELVGKERTRRDRIGLINKLGERNKVRYYSYSHFDEIYNAEFHRPLDYHEDMFKMFRATKINLNITFRLITKGISLRALDIMAAGGFLLSNIQEELVENFIPGVDFVCFTSEKDAVDKVEYYLEHDDERRKIAENGHEAVKRFSYDNQFMRILDIVFPGGVQ